MTRPQAVQVYSKAVANFVQRPLPGLQHVPAVLKYVLGLLFLINIRSWPLVWHYNVLVRPVYAIRIRWWKIWWRNVFASKTRVRELHSKFMRELCPVGEDPIGYTVSVAQWAGPDDCDFNWHLSNSSYPKQLDAARFRAALKICPTFYRVGGWTPLGATHFKFIREIPIFARYEMRMSIAAWEDKWFYVVVRYVTKAKPGSDKPRKSNPKKSTPKPIPSGDHAPNPQMHTPVAPSGTTTPERASTPSANAAERIAATLPPEPDAATLHCVAVCELCFKIGRKTIPPALVLAMEGFSVPPPPESELAQAGVARYSQAHPPPAFARSLEMQAADAPKGHLQTLQDFLVNGWERVPRGEQFWEEALGGEIEARRVRNLEAVKGVRLGMEGALTTYGQGVHIIRG